MPDREDHDEREAMAGELALGVLTGDERAVALRRVLAEPDFATEVEDWRMRLAPLLDGIADADAPDTAWQGIERGIAAPVGASVGRWRGAALAASAIAASLLVVLVARPTETIVMPPAGQVTVAATQIPLLAQVPGEEGNPIVTAQYDAASGRLRVRTGNLPVGERVPELWVIVGDAAPRSLGIVTLNGASDYLTAADLRRAMIDGATIAITLEPRSATPHAAPSGTILGTAKLTAV